MRTEFTDEEMFVAYSAQVVKSFKKRDPNISNKEVIEIMDIAFFKEKFLEDPSLYDFVEPDEAAQQILIEAAHNLTKAMEILDKKKKG